MGELNFKNNAKYDFVAPDIAADKDKTIEVVVATNEVVSYTNVATASLTVCRTDTYVRFTAQTKSATLTLTADTNLPIGAKCYVSFENNHASSQFTLTVANIGSKAINAGKTDTIVAIWNGTEWTLVGSDVATSSLSLTAEKSAFTTMNEPYKWQIVEPNKFFTLYTVDCDEVRQDYRITVSKNTYNPPMEGSRCIINFSGWSLTGCKLSLVANGTTWQIDPKNHEDAEFVFVNDNWQLVHQKKNTTSFEPDCSTLETIDPTNTSLSPTNYLTRAELDCSSLTSVNLQISTPAMSNGSTVINGAVVNIKFTDVQSGTTFDVCNTQYTDLTGITLMYFGTEWCVTGVTK